MPTTARSRIDTDIVWRMENLLVTGLLASFCAFMHVAP